MMDNGTLDRNEAIRARAHEIWESEGHPEGREAEHWTRAEAELFATDEGGALSDTATESGSMHEAMPDASGSDASPAQAAPDAASSDASGMAATGDDALGAKPARKPRRKPAAKSV